MLLRPRALPAGFVAPCLPTTAASPPSGEPWLHEIKHDGFRVIACKEGKRVKLYSRPGNDLTSRFSLIVEALARLRLQSCIIDGEASPVRMTALPRSIVFGTAGHDVHSGQASGGSGQPFRRKNPRHRVKRQPSAKGYAKAVVPLLGLIDDFNVMH